MNSLDVLINVVNIVIVEYDFEGAHDKWVVSFNLLYREHNYKKKSGGEIMVLSTIFFENNYIFRIIIKS